MIRLEKLVATDSAHKNKVLGVRLLSTGVQV
jgi:hypothetical protein